jgi:hypothetical protein
MNESKSIFASKTAVANLAVILSGLYPPVGAIVATNPQEALLVIGVMNLILRALTKKRVQLFPN